MAIPSIGIGTWELTGKECTKILKQALLLGYRHIDTAHVYKNHKAVREAIKDFDRKQLFLTSKIALEQIDLKNISESVEKACYLALKELGVEAIDLYLLHWPDHTLPLSKIYFSMENLKKKGMVKEVGVSNFTKHHLLDLFKDGAYPAFNQVEFHPYLYQKDLWEFCRKNRITLISYRPFGKSKLLKEPAFAKIGKKYGKSPAQVILRWLLQKQIPTIPKASSEAHLRDNLDIFDFSLTALEMKMLDQLNRNKRFCGEEEPELDY
jgi:diketogulonate reductase-like aldo/keto reductase